MGYAHIDNLYKNQDILMYRECYAMEKIHGTSAHISWRDGELNFFSGGASHPNFVALFENDYLRRVFEELGCPVVTVYGEAYGGSCQKMKDTYGPHLKFVAFEVKMGNCWLNVPSADDVSGQLGLDFVSYRQISTDMCEIEVQLARPSMQAVRNGMGDDKMREGIVLRPLIEVTKNNDHRVMAKYKNEAFQETKTPRKVDPGKLEELKEARAIAEEWVTEMRLSHVLDKLPEATDMTATRQVIAAMCEDVLREGEGEFEPTKAAMKAIGSRAAVLFKRRLQGKLKEA